MHLIKKTSAILVVFVVIFGLGGPQSVFAATSPTLVGASTYSVVAGSIVTNTGATTISGNVGISPSIGVPPHYTESGTTTYGVGSALHDADASAATAQADNTATFAALDAVPNVSCTTDYGAVTKELTGLSLSPGIYCANAFHLTGTLTLNDAGAPDGVWIFRSVLSTLVTSAGVGSKVVFATGVGKACNVWWKVASSATIGSGTEFIGNVLALTAISMGTGATLNGRLMAQTAAVTLDTNTISGPTCAASTPSGSTSGGNINVVKTVINDNGGTKKVSDFPLFVDGGSVVSGQTYNFPQSRVYNISETKDPNYTATFSGDCTSDGHLQLSSGDNRFCVITNNDIGAPVVTPPVPPLIDLVKVPSPLALPLGPGNVKYTYTLKNIGTVPVTDITLVGDTCSPIVLVSGDTNGDKKLDLTETWIHTCTTHLTATHTNNVVATGWANGISATDIASATVIVGKPIVPPLIHVLKKPSVFALAAPGGDVTYTYTVTNPGTAPLSNVTITDDKCTGLPGRVIGHPGDSNKNDLLESNESWSFICKSTLTATTTNTATASGEANGLIARDFAVATVVVAAAVPKLPNTGLFGGNETMVGLAILASLLSAVGLFSVVRKKERV